MHVALKYPKFPMTHIVPFGKFHKIGGAPPETFPNVKYDAPEEMSGERKCLTVLLEYEVWSKFLM